MLSSIEMVARDTRAKALERERLQTELTNYKAQIAMEQQSLNAVKNQVSNNKDKLETIRGELTDLAKRDKFLAKLRETLNMAILDKMSLENFYQGVDPDPQEQAKQCELLQAKYQEMLTNYKNNPEYLRYEELQAKEKELEERINQIKTEMMRLEAAETGCVEQVDDE